MNKNIAFTLAELLITLGIIGVVAALTMPNLITHYKKQEVETKLKRFYSNINQAIRLSEIDNGPKETWSVQSCEENESTSKCFFKKYYKNYLKTLKTEQSGNWFVIYFADGSILKITYDGMDYDYITDNRYSNHCTEGKNCFRFALYPNGARGARHKYFVGKGVEPYINVNWDGNFENLKLFNDSYVKIIQLNGWKIPDDYPIKF